MAVSASQIRVLGGMAAGVAITAVILVAGVNIEMVAPLEASNVAGRLRIGAAFALLPVACLAVAIARLARHRFVTPADIDGGGMTAGTPRAHLLQAQLQNTLEQTVLAVPVYLAWALLMPSTTLSVIALAAGAFVLGRVLFSGGYAHGAGARAPGFALTFYPSVAMLVGLAGWLATR